MGEPRLCRQCQTDPAGPDGFCSDTCMNQWDNDLMSDQRFEDDVEHDGGEA